MLFLLLVYGLPELSQRSLHSLLLVLVKDLRGSLTGFERLVDADQVLLELYEFWVKGV